MAIVYSAAQFFRDQSNYNKGHAAYRQVNCSVASAHFERVSNGRRIFDFGEFASRAQQEQAECFAFQSVLEQEKKGNVGQAIVAYNGFMSQHNSGSELVNAARDRVKSLFEKNKPEKIATKEFCNKLTQFQPDLIPQGDTNLPLLQFACGETYSSLKDYPKATLMYETFVDEYPDHSLLPQVKMAWAKTLVAQARTEGAGNLPAPQRSGNTGGSSSVVTIRNDSPEPMRIVFSGPEGRIEELEACSTCQKYVGQGPKACPNQGPVADYTLKPGEYDVVVKSRGDKLVRPFKGTWSMNQGWTYTNCFYIVTNPTPEERKQQ